MATMATMNEHNGQTLAVRVLLLLNRSLDTRELISETLREIQEFTGIQAVGVRLKKDDAYPCFVYHGSSRTFLEAENSLCTRDPSGAPVREAEGHPILDCVCAKVIEGRTDPRLPFFTAFGSFWTNSITALLAGNADADQHARFLNRCHGEGYESVALIPLRSEAETLGLFQLSDARRNRFTGGTIRLFEEIGVTIGIVLARGEAEDALRRALGRQEALIRERTRELESVHERLLTKLVEQRAAEKALKDSEERYRTLIESTSDVVWSVDTELRFTYVSQSITAILGYSVEEARSLDPLALLTPVSRDHLLRVFREEMDIASAGRSGTSRSRREEAEQYHKDGSVRWMEITMTFLRDDLGRVSGVLGVSRDVTERKKLEQAKSSFITLAAHKLRGPLTSVRGYSELLLIRDDLSPEEQRLSLERINSQAIALARIVDELSDISLLESGHGLTLQRSWFRLDEAICHAVNRHREQTPDHRFEVVMPGHPAEFFGDEARMKEVLNGVLSNAVTYSPNGGVIRVECGPVGESWQISVEDHGLGMTDDQVQCLFDTFYRADTSHTAVEGSGLGMTAVKHLVEAMGGTVHVQSRYGSGTRVSIRLPMW